MVVGEGVVGEYVGTADEGEPEGNADGAAVGLVVGLAVGSGVKQSPTNTSPVDASKTQMPPKATQEVLLEDGRYPEPISVNFCTALFLQSASLDIPQEAAGDLVGAGFGEDVGAREGKVVGEVVVGEVVGKVVVGEMVGEVVVGEVVGEVVGKVVGLSMQQKALHQLLTNNFCPAGMRSQQSFGGSLTPQPPSTDLLTKFAQDWVGRVFPSSWKVQ